MLFGKTEKLILKTPSQNQFQLPCDKSAFQINNKYFHANSESEDTQNTGS